MPHFSLCGIKSFYLTVTKEQDILCKDAKAGNCDRRCCRQDTSGHQKEERGNGSDFRLGAAALE
ncbi:hypothetical protein KSX_85570 [Ktedonospora formicarum]|uniref:Uncharacterized protein n=1 Tax=Ktedonospora formicarum TaxID=2778364 RepID=A0A8J3IFU3_9CHLR|nr:hypothetical protein KSX_85570 [Ktedonospora formicarum]